MLRVHDIHPNLPLGKDLAMFDLSVRRAEHIRHYVIRTADPSGWEVRFEEDRTLRRRVYYEDWHRVERALALFERELDELRGEGWKDC